VAELTHTHTHNRFTAGLTRPVIGYYETEEEWRLTILQMIDDNYEDNDVSFRSADIDHKCSMSNDRQVTMTIRSNNTELGW